ncbi:MAG: hypothetical protein ACO31E_06925 [Phycisphaerales bacterium]|jgi:hypothetical protein
MNLNPNSDQHAGNLPGDDEARTMPLSFEDGTDAITVAPGAGRKRFGFGAVLFTSVAAIALVSLFSMRAIGRAGAAEIPPSEASTLVDSFLKEREGKGGVDLKADLLDADGYMKLQISREELQKNPFILMGEELVLQVVPGNNAVKVETSAPKFEDPRPARGMTWDAACSAAASSVHVQSAMVSSNPLNSMAHVNGQVLRVGETLAITGSNVVFTITEVHNDGIVLRAWNEELQREAKFRVVIGGASGT